MRKGLGGRGKNGFWFFIKGRGGSERSESKRLRLQSQKCKGPEVGTRLRCWRQNEEGSVAGTGEEEPDHSGGDGLVFVLRAIRNHGKVCSREGQDPKQDFKKLHGAAG